jgi:short-subunit dehydrogenase
MAEPVCIVIGAGPGLGRAVAERFAREGCRIGLIARTAANLDDLAASLRSREIKCATAAADAGDEASLRAAIAFIVRELGDATVLVYNAVAFTAGTPSQVPPDALIADFRVNVSGAVTAVQAVLPAMKAARSGAILLTGGGLALHPNAQVASLSLGKTGTRCLAFMLAQELRTSGIRVATITIAGYMQTGTHFDPNLVAEVYWQAATDRKSEVEIVYK